MNLEGKIIIPRVSARSVWFMARHGEKEHEALERIKRNRLLT
jgi:hypothetical protein